MNQPARPVEDELRRIAEAGFEFVDLALEPPRAWPVDPDRIAVLVQELGLDAVGHTAYYLPIASPFPELAQAARALLVSALDDFARAGIVLVNVHPDPATRLVAPAQVLEGNVEALALLTDAAAQRGIKLMLENLGRAFAGVEELAPIFDAVPELGFHLDVGHAHMGARPGGPNRTAALLEAFGDRLAHVHVSDNLGVEDLHLPLGAGTVDWPWVVQTLKHAGWDGTVTLEVFDAEPPLVEASRRLWLDWWAAA